MDNTIKEIEEHICNLWLLNETSTDALAKKQTLANHKITKLYRKAQYLGTSLDEWGYCILDFIVGLIFVAGVTLIAFGYFTLN